MSLKPQPIQLVPKQTADVARAAFPKGNPYLIFRDEMGVIFQDDDFLDLYAQDGQPGFSPWRLAWVTIMQFRETLSDRQAAEAVRARLDWKYLLGLELTDPGFDFSVLSEFRGRLLAGSAEELLLDKVLQHKAGHDILYTSSDLSRLDFLSSNPLCWSGQQPLKTSRYITPDHVLENFDSSIMKAS